MWSIEKYQWPDLSLESKGLIRVLEKISVTDGPELEASHGLFGCRFGVGVRKWQPKKDVPISTCKESNAVNAGIPDVDDWQGFDFLFNHCLGQLVIKIRFSEHHGDSDVVKWLTSGVAEMQEEQRDQEHVIALNMCFFLYVALCTGTHASLNSGEVQVRMC